MTLEIREFLFFLLGVLSSEIFFTWKSKKLAPNILSLIIFTLVSYFFIYYKDYVMQNLDLYYFFISGFFSNILSWIPYPFYKITKKEKAIIILGLKKVVRNRNQIKEIARKIGIKEDFTEAILEVIERK